jgi:DNA-binding response OmpR family regulator
MKILIAEDDMTSRLILEATLVKLGHEVTTCADGQEAWQAFQKDYFPVLISDWLMPGIDGPTLCRTIRGQYREHYTFIILLTVLGGRANFLAAMDAGADDFISKPFDEDRLAARLRAAERILGLHQRIRKLEGLLPICTYCKNIRNNSGGWEAIDSFVSQHSEVEFSHGICPACFEKHVKPDLDNLRQ